VVKNQVVLAKAEVAAVEIEAEEVVAVDTAAVEAKAEAQAMAVAIEDAAAVAIEIEAETEKEHQERKEAATAVVKDHQKEVVHRPKEVDMEPEMADATEAMVVINLLVIDQVAREDVEEIKF
jgi:hypothetical protein